MINEQTDDNRYILETISESIDKYLNICVLVDGYREGVMSQSNCLRMIEREIYGQNYFRKDTNMETEEEVKQEQVFTPEQEKRIMEIVLQRMFQALSDAAKEQARNVG